MHGFANSFMQNFDNGLLILMKGHEWLDRINTNAYIAGTSTGLDTSILLTEAKTSLGLYLQKLKSGFAYI